MTQQQGSAVRNAQHQLRKLKAAIMFIVRNVMPTFVGFAESTLIVVRRAMPTWVANMEDSLKFYIRYNYTLFFVVVDQFCM